MDFFAHQQNARRTTLRLVGWFGLALVCFVGMLHVSAVMVLRVIGAWSSAHPWWDPLVLAMVAGSVLLVLGTHIWLKMV